ncbi:MAG: glutathione S-transferase family protein [Halomonas sp.]|nr:glutathione S-transferase family protein [Halomonas sp.]
MPLELFLNATSPYARIVRICALERGLEDRLVLNWVDPWADDAELLEVNPSAKVPALCTEERTALTETLPILLYLDNVGTAPALLPRDRLAEVLHGVGLGMSLLDASFQTVIERKHVGREVADRSVMGRRRLAAIERTLSRLEADTVPRCTYPDNTRLTLDDIVIGVTLDYLRFRLGEIEWPLRFPALAAWEDARLSRRSFHDTRFSG